MYREDLYPRSLTNPERVQEYCDNLSQLPPIEVNQHGILIDGWHRWTAHRKDGRLTIPAVITETESDVHILELAIERNATHGLQLSQEDKQRYARSRYHTTIPQEREALKKRLCSLLSVDERTIYRWLHRIDEDTKEAQQKEAFALWLACHTLQAISEALTIPVKTIHDWLGDLCDIGHLSESAQAIASHAVDFTIPLYNIWKQQGKTQGSSHFGNSEVRWVDNLLYLYTHPFDVVVDPFAGGGSTIDICKKRLRRYFVSDRKPIIEREKEIRCHDLTEGLPKVPRWQDVQLVYLDPPYWKQAEGAYSDGPTDLANMELEEFHSTLAKIITAFGRKLPSKAHIALLMQPTQWKAPDHRYTHHVFEMARRVKLPVAMCISCPYESQQCTAQMVDWAKAARQVLVLTRELVVWEVP